VICGTDVTNYLPAVTGYVHFRPLPSPSRSPVEPLAMEPCIVPGQRWTCRTKLSIRRSLLKTRERIMRRPSKLQGVTMRERTMRYQIVVIWAPLVLSCVVSSCYLVSHVLSRVISAHLSSSSSPSSSITSSSFQPTIRILHRAMKFRKCSEFCGIIKWRRFPHRARSVTWQLIPLGTFSRRGLNPIQFTYIASQPDGRLR